MSCDLIDRSTVNTPNIPLGFVRLAHSRPGMRHNPRGTPALVRIPAHEKISVRLTPPKICSRPKTDSSIQFALGNHPSTPLEWKKSSRRDRDRRDAWAEGWRWRGGGEGGGSAASRHLRPAEADQVKVWSSRRTPSRRHLRRRPLSTATATHGRLAATAKHVRSPATRSSPLKRPVAAFSPVSASSPFSSFLRFLLAFSLHARPRSRCMSSFL